MSRKKPLWRPISLRIQWVEWWRWTRPAEAQSHEMERSKSPLVLLADSKVFLMETQSAVPGKMDFRGASGIFRVSRMLARSASVDIAKLTTWVAVRGFSLPLGAGESLGRGAEQRIGSI